jgi:Smg protein
MNENVVDILIYLYENYMDGEQAPPSDQHELRDELIQAGFPAGEIDKAFDWLDELANSDQSQHSDTRQSHSLRVFTEEENSRLDLDSRGLLLFLEQNDILTVNARELVIDRALALDTAVITEEELKWIILLVLMNQPGQEAAFARMEDMVYNEVPVFLH